MNEQKQSQGEKGEFFSMNLAMVDHMVGHDAGAEDVMAYMVLARGVNRRGDLSISTHGANSIATRTGMSNRRATSALAWLSEHGYIVKPKADKEAAQNEAKARQARWVIVETVETIDKEDIYLANSLTDGVGRGKNNPPLMRIYGEANHSGGYLLSDARLDTLMVLLHLYRHHDIADCGGVDPRVGIFRDWESTENANGETVTDLDGTNAALYEVHGGGDLVFPKFAAEALFYIEDAEESVTRFWDALRNLKRMGFLYEVTQIWSKNPNGKDGRKAEPLYTLYIHDRHARESEPYLAKDIHKMAFNLGAMDAASEFVPSSQAHYKQSENIVGTGRFRYLATRKNGGFPIGIYRLRFRARTRDTGIGIEAERRRVDGWAKAVLRLNAVTTQSHGSYF